MNTNQQIKFNQNVHHRNRTHVHSNLYTTHDSTENAVSTVFSPPWVVQCRDFHTPNKLARLTSTLCLKSETECFKIMIRTQQQCINISTLLWQHVSVLLDHLQASIQR